MYVALREACSRAPHTTARFEWLKLRDFPGAFLDAFFKQSIAIIHPPTSGSITTPSIVRETIRVLNSLVLSFLDSFGVLILTIRLVEMRKDRKLCHGVLFSVGKSFICNPCFA